MAGFAGPAHTGVLGIAIRRDQQRSLNQFAILQVLWRLKVLINQGKLDHISWLNQVIAQLNARQSPDQGFARMAREVIGLAKVRRRQLLQNYNGLLNQSPEVRSRINRMFPNLLRPVQ